MERSRAEISICALLRLMLETSTTGRLLLARVVVLGFRCFTQLIVGRHEPVQQLSELLLVRHQATTGWSREKDVHVRSAVRRAGSAATIGIAAFLRRERPEKRAKRPAALTMERFSCVYRCLGT